MKTAAYISDNALYVVSTSENNDQNIFNIGGNIVFGRNCNQTILKLFKKLGHKKASAASLAKYAQKHMAEGEMYVCGRAKKGFSVIKVDKKGIAEIKNQETDDVVCRSVPYSSLVDNVIEFLQTEQDEPQFGFVCSKSAKTLYGRDTELYLIPGEYSREGLFCRRKDRKNTEAYQRLTSHLEAIVSLQENKHDNLNVQRREQLTEKEHKIKFETYSIINDYLVPKPVLHLFKKNKVLSETELSDMVRGDIEHLIVSLRKNQALGANDNEEIKNEQASELERIYSGKSRTFKYAHSVVLAVDKRDAEKIRGEIQSSDMVEEVRKPYIVRIPKPVISPVEVREVDKLNMWNLELIGAYEAWLKTKGEGVRIGIIDTGCDYRHENLKDRFDQRSPGFDFVRNNTRPLDENGHGTHVAGTVAGAKTGVAPESTLYALRVLDSYGCGSEIDVILALEWAVDHNLNVVNMSIGFGYDSIPLGDACKVAVDKGIVVCAAAGNEAYEPCFPGDYDFPGIISVAAVDKSHKRPFWSRISENNDLSAPGIDIISSTPENSYAKMSGTSMATPHVAGSAALVMAYCHEEPLSIEKMLEQNTEDIGEKEKYGFGLVRPDFVLMAQRRRQLALALSR
jgi:vacuolar-type H+-ATPase subunit F/Vma7